MVHMAKDSQETDSYTDERVAQIIKFHKVEDPLTVSTMWVAEGFGASTQGKVTLGPTPVQGLMPLKAGHATVTAALVSGYKTKDENFNMARNVVCILLAFNKVVSQADFCDACGIVLSAIGIMTKITPHGGISLFSRPITGDTGLSVWDATDRFVRMGRTACFEPVTWTKDVTRKKDGSPLTFPQQLSSMTRRLFLGPASPSWRTDMRQAAGVFPPGAMQADKQGMFSTRLTLQVFNPMKKETEVYWVETPYGALVQPGLLNGALQGKDDAMPINLLLGEGGKLRVANGRLDGADVIPSREDNPISTAFPPIDSHRKAKHPLSALKGSESDIKKKRKKEARAAYD